MLFGITNAYLHGAICGVIGGAIYALYKYMKGKKHTGNPRHFGKRR